MKSVLKVLCLEDDEEDFEFVSEILQKSSLVCVTKRVDTEDKFRTSLTEFNPDVILSDHALPQFNSMEALRVCKSKEIKVPFILVTGAVSDEFAVTCLKQGADDYILKSNLNRLPSAIKNALKLKEIEQAKLKAIAELALQNDELVKTNKEVDSLVYSVSHNLRAPLMSVLGLINLAKRENSIDTLHQFHHMMEDTILKLDDTLKEILDYSKNARLELQIEKVNLQELIEDTFERMRFMPGFARMDIQVSIRNGIELYSDYYRLSVIINNLISNAIKYQDKYKETARLHIHGAVENSKALLRFEDNGMGIDNKLISKIFDMFFRANTEKDGSGLGLYIVREAVEKLQGKIDIKSELGEGTTFILEIPNYNREYTIGGLT
ncbi:MAG TPA: hybrid sensor histidine kinase/response regulator [Cyclobacteriaceae bacterium]|nr:hybrid sensor histidine kinase/response regulator [Cyclobacteriaceae bacterium]